MLSIWSISPVSSPIESMLKAMSGSTFWRVSAVLSSTPSWTRLRESRIASEMIEFPAVSLEISSDIRIGTPARVSELKIRQN